MLPGLVLAVKF